MKLIKGSGIVIKSRSITVLKWLIDNYARMYVLVLSNTKFTKKSVKISK